MVEGISFDMDEFPAVVACGIVKFPSERMLCTPGRSSLLGISAPPTRYGESETVRKDLSYLRVALWVKRSPDPVSARWRPYFVSPGLCRFRCPE